MQNTSRDTYPEAHVLSGDTKLRVQRTRGARGARCIRASLDPPARAPASPRAIQGYLAHQKQHPPRNLQWSYAEGPMVALEGGGGGLLDAPAEHAAQDTSAHHFALPRARLLPPKP